MGERLLHATRRFVVHDVEVRLESCIEKWLWPDLDLARASCIPAQSSSIASHASSSARMPISMVARTCSWHTALKSCTWTTRNVESSWPSLLLRIPRCATENIVCGDDAHCAANVTGVERGHRRVSRQSSRNRCLYPKMYILSRVLSVLNNLYGAQSTDIIQRPDVSLSVCSRPAS